MDPDLLEMIAAEVTIGEEGGGWTPEDIQGAAELKLPMSLTRQKMEVVDNILNLHPDLQASIQEMNNEPLAKSTMQNYKGTLKKLQEFCQGKYTYDELSEQAILHFIADLNKKGASFSVVAQVKPAIVLLLEMQTGGAANFTARADRWCEAAKRKAAKKRPPTRKAGEVSLDKLKSMVDKHVTQFKNNIGEPDIFKLRCVTKMVVEYFTFCRFADFQQLKAKDIEEVGEDLLITFPSSKNDQYHNGQSTLLKRNGTDFCPVLIVKLYYKRMGFKLIRRVAGRRYGDSRQAASQATSREEITQTMSEMGFSARGVTDKSFKMLGVTQALKARMTLEEVAQHGRWRTTEMPLRYKHNSIEYKAEIADVLLPENLRAHLQLSV
jgi:hypothetical protein